MTRGVKREFTFSYLGWEKKKRPKNNGKKSMAYQKLKDFGKRRGP